MINKSSTVALLKKIEVIRYTHHRVSRNFALMKVRFFSCWFLTNQMQRKVKKKCNPFYSYFIFPWIDWFLCKVHTCIYKDLSWYSTTETTQKVLPIYFKICSRSLVWLCSWIDENSMFTCNLFLWSYFLVNVISYPVHFYVIGFIFDNIITKKQLVYW